MGSSGRGWGPFTGRQLTTMVCVIVAAVAFPVAASAVSGSSVFVTDSTSGAHAKVSSTGALNVTGSVNDSLAPPASTFTYFAGATEATGCNPVTPAVPAGKALVVTSVNVAVTGVTTGPVFIAVDAASTSPCAPIESFDESYVPGAQTSEDVQIPSGVVIKPGHVVAVLMDSTSNDASAVVHVHGYYVASTLCTASGPPAGCL